MRVRRAASLPLLLLLGCGGEGCGGDPNGCNVCHSAFADNDYVATPGFRLQDF